MEQTQNGISDERLAELAKLDCPAAHWDDFGCHLCERREMAGELTALRARHKRLVEALEGVQPYMEAAEKAGLVGDEGCHWPVEIVRAALTEDRKLEGK